MSRREFTVLVSMLMALTALATDMMLPAFGDMRTEFGLPAASSAVAPVVTVFFIGFGCGRLVATRAPTLGSLLLLRLVGGLGAAAVRVTAQGTVRDRYRGDEMAKTLSYIMAVFILVPTIAPSIGTVILVVGSWRAIFVFFALFAFVAALWSLRLPETLPEARRLPLDHRRIGAAIRTVAGSRFSMGLALAQMAAFGFFASYLASSELIIGDVFGLGAWFPLIFGAGALAIGSGMLVNPRLIDRRGLRAMVRYVMVGNFMASIVFAAIALASGGRPPFWLYFVGLAPLLLAHAFIVPNLNAAAMLPMGNLAGTASAVIGALVTLGGALIGALIDRFYDSTMMPFAVGGMICGAAAFVFYRWADAVWVEAAGRELAVPARTLAEPLPPGPDPT